MVGGMRRGIRVSVATVALIGGLTAVATCRRHVSGECTGLGGCTALWDDGRAELRGRYDHLHLHDNRRGYVHCSLRRLDSEHHRRRR